MKSLRKTLSVSIVGGLLILTVVSGSVGYIWARHALTHQLDSILIAKARSLANLVEEEDGEIHFEFTDDNMPEFASGKSDHFFQVWLSDGTVLARSESLAGVDLPRLQGTPKDPDATLVQLGGHRNLRVVGFQFFPIQEVAGKRFFDPTKTDKASIVVSRDTAELEMQVSTIFWIILMSALLLPSLSAVIVNVSVRRGLRPLDRLAAMVGKIDASSLETRISEGEDIMELRPITTKLNDLLVRLQAAFERERRFTMDASHELRTPLAESRTALEIALKWPDDHNLLIDSTNQALEATYQMEGLVVALLAFARAESDKTEGPREKLILSEIVRHCWGQLSGAAHQKNISLSMDRVGEASVHTNKALAIAIITNLLSNAVRYAPVGSVVDISAETAAETNAVTLTVSNEMETTLIPDDLDHLFEPLWRKDKSRTDDSPALEAHFGLGLALVKAYCEKLGIRVTVDLSHGLFHITLGFPATA